MVPDKILNTVLGVFFYIFVQNYDNLHPKKVFRNEYGLIKILLLTQETILIWCKYFSIYSDVAANNGENLVLMSSVFFQWF